MMQHDIATYRLALNAGTAPAGQGKRELLIAALPSSAQNCCRHRPMTFQARLLTEQHPQDLLGL